MGLFARAPREISDFPSGGDLRTGPRGRPPRGHRLARLVSVAGLAAALPLLAGVPSIDMAGVVGPRRVITPARAEEAAPPARVAQVAAPPAAPAPPAQVQAQMSAPPASDAWGKMPKMKLEAVYGGPLRDTIVQRWRDPVDGTVCYIYLPINAPTTPVQASGFVQYGATGIGSLSCMAAAAPSQQVAQRPAPVAPAPIGPSKPAVPAKP